MDFKKIVNIINKKSKFFKVMYLLISFLVVNTTLAASYIYDISDNEEMKSEESSISTIATPEFTFQSASQVLMEPSTGNIIYANNENERLLPASVTKVMTLLLTMEQIDSRKIKL